jgi:hypothetical protein
MSMIHTRWAAVGAAIAVTLGAGGLTFVDAATGSGDRPVTVTIDPCRLRDTRPDRGVGGRTTPLGPAEAYTVQGTGPSGNCNIATDATGLVLNVTADQATQATNLRLYPTGGTVPTTSNVNPRPGAAPTPNAATVGLNDAGEFDIRNAKGSVHVIIDVTAYLVHHTHDDRYYSKRDSDARFVQIEQPTAYRPHLLELIPHPGTNWQFIAGWLHQGAISECLNAELDAPAGTTISSVSVNYKTDAPVQVSAQVGGILAGTGSSAIEDRLIYHLTKKDATLPATSDITTYTFEHDPNDVPFGLTRVPVGDESYHTVLSICTADLFWLTAVRVTYG